MAYEKLGCDRGDEVVWEDIMGSNSPVYSFGDSDWTQEKSFSRDWINPVTSHPERQWWLYLCRFLKLSYTNLWLTQWPSVGGSPAFNRRSDWIPAEISINQCFIYVHSLILKKEPGCYELLSYCILRQISENEMRCFFDLPSANRHRIRQNCSFSATLGWVPSRPIIHSLINPYMQNNHVTVNNNKYFSNSCWGCIFDWNKGNAAGRHLGEASLLVSVARQDWTFTWYPW